GRARRRRRHRQHLRLDDPVGREAARAPRRAPGHPVAGLRPHRGGRLLRPARVDPRLRPRLMPLATNPLIQVTPGLMIWTIICFLISVFVLKRYAFGPIQKLIDERRERIRQSIEEADHAREEARKLLEEHRKLIGQAKNEAEGILVEARKVADANERRMREETETDRQRRLEDTRKQIEAETRRALDLIRTEVAELSLVAAEKVTWKSLDDADHRRLIEEAVGELDFSVLETNE